VDPRGVVDTAAELLTTLARVVVSDGEKFAAARGGRGGCSGQGGHVCFSTPWIRQWIFLKSLLAGTCG